MRPIFPPGSLKLRGQGPKKLGKNWFSVKIQVAWDNIFQILDPANFEKALSAFLKAHWDRHDDFLIFFTGLW